MKPTAFRVSHITAVCAAIGFAFTAFAADAWDQSRNLGSRNTGAQFGLGFSQSQNGSVTIGGYYSDRGSRGWDRDRRGNRGDRYDWRRNQHNRSGGFNGAIIWRSGPARPYWYRSPFDPFGSRGYINYSAPRVIAWVVLPAFVYDRLSVRSRGFHEQAYWRAMSAPVGQSIAWNDGINTGRIATTRDGYAGSQYCREFQQTITVGGRREEAYGTACQEPDGSWRLVEAR
ncbi:MAG: hypothetical protein KDE14_08235 [Rhodobacteraceae bacterium]|nr:hypothetical protein [Paracoccaceae bacterium]